jgi:hypothetical protein
MGHRLNRFLPVTILLASAAAQSAVVTFGEGYAESASNYREAGMVISYVGPSHQAIADWPQYCGTLSVCAPPVDSGGERELLFSEGNNTERMELTFSLLSGRSFNLHSFDVENPSGRIPWSAFSSFELVGSNGASAVFLGDDFGTKMLSSDFEDLSWFSVSCLADYPSPCQATIDNITFDRKVPEPATLALVGAALFGVVATRRRRLTSP